MVEHDVLRFDWPCLMWLNMYETLHTGWRGGGSFHNGKMCPVVYGKSAFENWVLRGLVNSSLQSFRGLNLKIWKGKFYRDYD